MEFTAVQVPVATRDRLKELSLKSGISMNRLIEKTLPGIEQYLRELSLIQESAGRNGALSSEDTPEQETIQKSA